MSDGRSELLVYLGAALATLIGLFVLHRWYGSFIDNQHHANMAVAGPNEATLALREDDKKQLAAGKMPLEKAMSQIAQRGRGSFGSIAPTGADDLSAIAGWIQMPGFKPAVHHPIRTPRVEPTAPPPAVGPVAEPAPEPAKPQPSKRKPAR